MKWIIEVSISTKNQHLQTVRKEFTNNYILPSVGLEIEDTAWKDPKKIVNVTYNPTEDYASIVLEEDIIPEESKLKLQIEMYKNHSWKTLG